MHREADSTVGSCAHITAEPVATPFALHMATHTDSTPTRGQEAARHWRFLLGSAFLGHLGWATLAGSSWIVSHVVGIEYGWQHIEACTPAAANVVPQQAT